MNRLFLLIFVFISTTTYAQFGIGPKFAIEFSGDLVTHTNNSVKPYSVPYIGNTVSLSIVLVHSGVFHFNPEFYYSQIGSRYYFPQYDITYTQKRNYFGINSLFNIGFTKNNFRLYGQPGFYFSYLASGLLETNNAGSVTYTALHTGNSFFGNDGFPIDFGFLFGFAIEYKLGNGWLSLNPRYKFGILPHSYDLLSSSDMYFNKSYSMNISYIFVIGNKD